MSRVRRAPQSLARVFAWPLALFAASLAGLVLGLTGDGWEDVLAVALLAAAPFAIAAAWLRRDRPRHSLQTERDR
ncbi:hypothetical protein MKP08_01835 [Erythrobacter sp. LQ02-29]|uniref:hypothetical protein n=1 Tax=Erythrobacter sp. LQ02-29 TaxID=2920384 RepID=UPI001F4DDA44|nr:hypothetical protein [Erythrobacter sp. LQ02-29]MCP9221488.1 hypothetical protein [Erythrobacter sp. LQ02-29]